MLIAKSDVGERGTAGARIKYEEFGPASLDPNRKVDEIANVNIYTDLLLRFAEKSGLGRLSRVQSTSGQIPRTMGLANQKHMIVDTDDTFGGNAGSHERTSRNVFMACCAIRSNPALHEVELAESNSRRLLIS